MACSQFCWIIVAVVFLSLFCLCFGGPEGFRLRVPVRGDYSHHRKIGLNTWFRGEDGRTPEMKSRDDQFRATSRAQAPWYNLSFPTDPHTGTVYQPQLPPHFLDQEGGVQCTPEGACQILTPSQHADPTVSAWTLLRDHEIRNQEIHDLAQLQRDWTFYH